MRRNNGWWMAVVVGVVMLASPADRLLAQDASEADGESMEAIDEDFAWFGGFDGDGAGGARFAEGHELGGHGGGRMGPRGGHEGGGHGGGMRHFARMLHQLDLNADQVKKIEDIHDRAMRKQVQSHADMRIAQMDLHKLMKAESPDRRAIEAQIDKLGAMRTAQRKAHVSVMFEARALLTPEQKKKMQELHGAGPGMHGRAGPGMEGRRMRERHSPETHEDAH